MGSFFSTTTAKLWGGLLLVVAYTAIFGVPFQQMGFDAAYLAKKNIKVVTWDPIAWQFRELDTIHLREGLL